MRSLTRGRMNTGQNIMNIPEHLINHPEIDEGKDWDKEEAKQEEEANADYGIDDTVI